jgi:hypothetical protein
VSVAGPVQTGQIRKPITFHATSVAVWDGPSPASIGLPARARVGVRCAKGCCLEGHTVQIRDEADNCLGEGVLGTDPLMGADALYWSEISFPAPAVPGVFFRTAAYAPPATHAEDPEQVVHHASSARFSFRTDPMPEHVVTVRVSQEDTSAPAPDMEIRLGLYAAYTDGSGQAHIRVPTGTYTCSMRRDGFEADPVSLDVDRDLIIGIKACRSFARGIRCVAIFVRGPSVSLISGRLTSGFGIRGGA